MANNLYQFYREFYRNIKSLRTRNENYNPTTIINNANGQPLIDKEDIKERWKEYFSDILNPRLRNKSKLTEEMR
jgi:hypothetical protein